VLNNKIILYEVYSVHCAHLKDRRDQVSGLTLGQFSCIIIREDYFLDYGKPSYLYGFAHSVRASSIVRKQLPKYKFRKFSKKTLKASLQYDKLPTKSNLIPTVINLIGTSYINIDVNLSQKPYFGHRFAPFHHPIKHKSSSNAHIP
jgi:hypothetical protein